MAIDTIDNDMDINITMMMKDQTFNLDQTMLNQSI